MNGFAAALLLMKGFAEIGGGTTLAVSSFFGISKMLEVVVLGALLVKREFEEVDSGCFCKVLPVANS